MLRAWPQEGSVCCNGWLAVGSAEILSLPRNGLRPSWARRPQAWQQDLGKGVWGVQATCSLRLDDGLPLPVP